MVPMAEHLCWIYHVCKIPKSELNRRVVNIPKFVWHAGDNVGNTDVVVIELPTELTITRIRTNIACRSIRP
jgi:hypothetical protein